MSVPPTTEPDAAMPVDYWRLSRRPLVSLVFVAPLLIAYEGGILLLGSSAMRNGADAWLRMLLSAVGFGQYFLLPVLTVGLLLGWHHINRDPWYVPRWVLWGMAAECLSLSLVLVVIAYVQGMVLGSLLGMGAREIGNAPSELAAIHAQLSHSDATLLPLANFITRFFAKAISFCGAGIYEEVLFRLMMLTGLTSLFKLVGAPPAKAAWGAIVISSLLFSLAHYVGAEGDPLELSSFLFRFIAGAFFAVLFVKRGFGIAAGTHALYDIIVGLLI